MKLYLLRIVGGTDYCPLEAQDNLPLTQPHAGTNGYHPLL
jgi:hypothetical protein